MTLSSVISVHRSTDNQSNIYDSLNSAIDPPIHSIQWIDRNYHYLLFDQWIQLYWDDLIIDGSKINDMLNTAISLGIYLDSFIWLIFSF